MNSEMAKSRLNEYKCFFCGVAADRIGLYQETFPDGKNTIKNPTLFCTSCWGAVSKKNQIGLAGGNFVKVYCKLFSTLGKMTTKEIGFLTGRKNYQVNQLSSRMWRKIVFNIHYLNIPPKEKATGIKEENQPNAL
jgi:hypothetical protein